MNKKIFDLTPARIEGIGQILPKAVITYSEEIYYFVVTLGDIESSLNAVNALQEAVTEVKDMIYKECVKPSPLLCPGNDGIDIDLIGQICKIAGSEKIGVTVSGFGVMKPTFSNCAMIIRNDKEKNRKNPCENCIGNWQGCQICMARDNKEINGKI